MATRGTEGYWAAALRDYERLARELGGEHPKLHWILGEHFYIERPEEARRPRGVVPGNSTKAAVRAEIRGDARRSTLLATGGATGIYGRRVDDAESRGPGRRALAAAGLVGAEEQLRAALERGAPEAAGPCLLVARARGRARARRGGRADRAMAAGARTRRRRSRRPRAPGERRTKRASSHGCKTTAQANAVKALLQL